MARARLTGAIFAACFAFLAAACGDDDGSGKDGGGGGGIDAGGGGDIDAGGGGDIDAGGGGDIDAGGIPGCTPGGTECTNCIDDDDDGDVDGFDAECISSADDDESSFATGIPGDNEDEKHQDCFFDGNSGGSCQIHTCCILDECPPELQGGFDPDSCAVSAECIAECIDIVPPGCDCFGCCTVCNDVGCFDILTSPAVAPDCDPSVAGDPELCPPCTKIADCENPCDPVMCILCPGQDPDDLPDECDTPTCIEGPSCTATSDCGADEFCANGCCIPQVE